MAVVHAQTVRCILKPRLLLNIKPFWKLQSCSVTLIGLVANQIVSVVRRSWGFSWNRTESILSAAGASGLRSRFITNGIADRGAFLKLPSWWSISGPEALVPYHRWPLFVRCTKLACPQRPFLIWNDKCGAQCSSELVKWVMLVLIITANVICW